MLGLNFPDDIKDRLKQKNAFIFIVPMLLAVGCVVLNSFMNIFPQDAFFLRDGYAALSQSWYVGIATRIAIFAIAVVFSLFIMRFMPDGKQKASGKKGLLAAYGEDTMCLYCLHPYFITLINYAGIKLGIMHDTLNIKAVLLYVVGTLAILLVFRIPFIKKCFNGFFEFVNRILFGKSRKEKML